ncbi:MAG: A/G-specific adenine glycosylase [Geminicoccaceae bacterium]|nr:MAG: A/G-specific adenine glycosylase [Geminicoccaceae bacterium]
MRRGVRPTLPVLPAAPAELRAVLLDWWDATRRDLPWRARPGERPDPWAVLTSEVMLQQTTAATVAGRFPAFFARFPSPSALARAELEEVLHAWQGLGYYRRARALHACAQAIETGHGGRVPDDPAALRRLPGLGPYTVAAVAAIAFDRPMVPVDGNVVRVGTRLLGLQLEPGAARTRVAEALAPLGLGPRPGDLAQALMELGALVCRPRGPDCAACPWRDPCRARASGAPDRLPLRPPRKIRPEQTTLAFLVRRADGAVWLRRRPEKGILGGMLELPSSPWGPARTIDEDLAHAPVAAAWEPVVGEVRHVFTHLVLRARLVRARLPEGAAEPRGGGRWFTPAELGRAPLPTLTRNLLRLGGLEPPPPPGRARS